VINNLITNKSGKWVSIQLYETLRIFLQDYFVNTDKSTSDASQAPHFQRSLAPKKTSQSVKLFFQELIQFNAKCAQRNTSERQKETL
jgi:hypothetical protein